MTSLRFLIFLLTATGSVWILAGCMPPLQPSPTFEIETADENHVMYVVEDDSVTFDISSPSGIGKARIVLTAGDWPTNVFLNLNLGGMESLEVAYDKITVDASVSSHGEHEIQQSVQLDGGAMVAADEADSHQLTVDIVSGQPVSIPLQEGYFQVRLGEGFHEVGSRELDVSWIDFYR